MGVSDLENAMKEEKGRCISAGNKDMITNTMFEHNKRRLVTWTSPGGYRNKID